MKYVLILLGAIILTSCEGVIDGKGKIVSIEGNKPIDSVLVYWTNLQKTVYSDSLGKFEIGLFCGCVPECPEMELIFYKKGYETKYLNYTKEYGRKDSAIITLSPGKKNSVRIEETDFERFVKYFNLSIISLINVFTLIMMCRLKIEYRTLCILFLIFFSTTLKYNYFTCEMDVSMLSFFIQLAYLKIYYIGWYVFFIPTASIIFWSHYFYNKRKMRVFSENLIANS